MTTQQMKKLGKKFNWFMTFTFLIAITLEVCFPADRWDVFAVGLFFQILGMMVYGYLLFRNPGISS